MSQPKRFFKASPVKGRITTVFCQTIVIAGLSSCGGGGGSSSGNNAGSAPGPAPASNSAPFANAGADQTVGIGFDVSLSGAGSTDADGDSLSYSWTLDSSPEGSTASLNSTSGVTSGITPDRLGDYVISLVVNDGTADSAADRVTITVVNRIDSLGLTDIVLRDGGAALIADFHTPAPISQRLAEERLVAWAESVDVPQNLTRFSFGDDATADIFSATDTATSVDASLAITPGLATDTLVDNDLLLRSTFQFVEVDTGKYAIYSTRHSNYALDANGTDIVLRDVRTVDAYNSGTASFLTFAAGASPLILVANGRYTINNAVNNTLDYTADTDWTNREVVLNGTALELAATGGTSMKLYEEPIRLDIPTDFNPDNVARVANEEYFDPNRNQPDDFESGISGLVAAYRDQTAAEGSDAGTLAAAEAMLDAIEIALAAQGSQTRYPRQFYLALREGMFERVIQSSESFNGEMGDLATPYIYFTNETDDAGDFHPFMVIASRNIPDGFTHLRDVPRPPGDGLGGGFANENVTRGFFRKNYLLKIPLRDYGEVATPGENTNVPVFDANPNDHHAYASTGQVGVAIDGVLLFPAYNNRGRFSQELGEISAVGLHAGRGLDAHYHADPHSAALNNANRDTGLSFYNEEDYAGRSHPPITSIGLDGVAGYGFYLDGDTTSHGVNVPLDGFGAHEHDDYGYHYHASSEDRTSDDANAYTTHEMGPLGAWAGRANFMPAIQVGEGNTTNRWVGNGPGQ